MINNIILIIFLFLILFLILSLSGTLNKTESFLDNNWRPANTWVDMAFWSSNALHWEKVKPI